MVVVMIAIEGRMIIAEELNAVAGDTEAMNTVVDMEVIPVDSVVTSGEGDQVVRKRIKNMIPLNQLFLQLHLKIVFLPPVKISTSTIGQEAVVMEVNDSRELPGKGKASRLWQTSIV